MTNENTKKLLALREEFIKTAGTLSFDDNEHRKCIIALFRALTAAVPEIQAMLDKPAKLVGKTRWHKPDKQYPKIRVALEAKGE